MVVGRVVGLVAVALAGVLLVVWRAPLPWAAACGIDGPGGRILGGSPDEVRGAVAESLDGSGDDRVAQALASGPVLTCRIPPIRATGTPKDLPVGLTPRAAVLRAEVRATFGDVPDGGFGPEDVLPGRRAGGEHSLGRAIDFFYRPHEDPEQAAAGWRLANWAVANAQRLGIRTVIYRDRIWTASRSAQGWRDYRFRGPDPLNPINRHLDHVHLDVA